jgi:hypothetical protein
MTIFVRLPSLKCGPRGEREIEAAGTKPHARLAKNEPSVADLLSDPIAQALMRADGIAVEDVIALLERVRGQLTS